MDEDMLDDELKESGMHVDEGEEEEALDPETGLPMLPKKALPPDEEENPDAEDEDEDDEEDEE